MKTRKIQNQVVAGLVLAFTSFTFNHARAVSATPQQTGPAYSAESSPFQFVDWEESKREKLRHAYHLLDHADGDYGGHREAAMRSIREAAKAVGVADFHWTEHGEETQWKSDRRLREARQLLEDLTVEHEAQPHLRRAIKEIDKALERK